VPWARFDDSQKLFANAEPGHLLMVKHWNDFGFVLADPNGDGTTFIEQERAPNVTSTLP
jgi:hypothetical protein